ncbi:hypothetical protein J2Z69_000320 [Paenibacillus shirakamiensis]|uniref:Copper amine oxidase n=1 Tax=Paenibacillus shirakamiensis TaxID=1265935 RepID=A0ABS4JEB1_9BACL|nr:copper amine oxidase [Paenibacillus shirakamiensis]MBP1999301.1 hypothetical protein [Paenibacillus shirakamiensis]
MKWKKVAVLVLTFSLLGGTMMFADGAMQKVRLILNGKEVEDGGVMIDGKTYVPVRELNGLINYDDSSKKVTYNLPNVSMFLFKGDTPFGIVNTGKLKFKVFCQIDSLKADISSVKVAIKAPDGSIKSIQSQDITNQKDNFWFITNDYTYEFKTSGKYSIGFYMKQGKNADYVLVSEKVVSTQD